MTTWTTVEGLSHTRHCSGCGMWQRARPPASLPRGPFHTVHFLSFHSRKSENRKRKSFHRWKSENTRDSFWHKAPKLWLDLGSPADRGPWPGVCSGQGLQDGPARELAGGQCTQGCGRGFVAQHPRPRSCSDTVSGSSSLPSILGAVSGPPSS